MQKKLVDRIREELERKDNVTDDIALSCIYSFVKERYDLNFEQKESLIKSIFFDIRKLGPLQEWIDNEEVDEIMVNGKDNMFVERNGVLSKVSSVFESDEELVNIIQKIVSKVNRSINAANPVVDARLLDGSRIHAVLPPISLNGPVLNIRKFKKTRFSLDDYVKFGSISQEARDDLSNFVKSKYNIFISGSTSSGKTTFLNALSLEMDKKDRIITIEDSAELQLANENWVRLETRSASSNNIEIKDLIKASLRMRPDRLIVGEVRSKEALDMLEAMNTGHDGCLSTAHANSARDMLVRLENMIYSNVQIPLEVIRKQIHASLEILVHLGRDRSGKRKVLSINEIVGIENNEIKLNVLYEFLEDTKSLVKKGNLKRTRKLKEAGLL